MDYNQIVTTQPQLIDIAKLEKSPQNARRTVRKDGIDELKASILAHGLMQNLVVTVAGKSRYHVIAGARRLEALHALQKEGKLPDGHTVLCQVVTADHGLEMSLAENTVRLAMHPADEFEAFSKLSEQGESAEAIASRFGVEEKHVLKRLKLGRVAPALLKDTGDKYGTFTQKRALRRSKTVAEDSRHECGSRQESCQNLVSKINDLP